MKNNKYKAVSILAFLTLYQSSLLPLSAEPINDQFVHRHMSQQYPTHSREVSSFPSGQSSYPSYAQGPNVQMPPVPIHGQLSPEQRNYPQQAYGPQLPPNLQDINTTIFTRKSNLVDEPTIVEISPAELTALQTGQTKLNNLLEQKQIGSKQKFKELIEQNKNLQVELTAQEKEHLQELTKIKKENIMSEGQLKALTYHFNDLQKQRQHLQDQLTIQKTVYENESSEWRQKIEEEALANRALKQELEKNNSFYSREIGELQKLKEIKDQDLQKLQFQLNSLENKNDQMRSELQNYSSQSAEQIKNLQNESHLKENQRLSEINNLRNELSSTEKGLVQLNSALNYYRDKNLDVITNRGFQLVNHKKAQLAGIQEQERQLANELYAIIEGEKNHLEILKKQMKIYETNLNYDMRNLMGATQAGAGIAAVPHAFYPAQTYPMAGQQEFQQMQAQSMEKQSKNRFAQIRNRDTLQKQPQQPQQPVMYYQPQPAQYYYPAAQTYGY